MPLDRALTSLLTARTPALPVGHLPHWPRHRHVRTRPEDRSRSLLDSVRPADSAGTPLRVDASARHDAGDRVVGALWFAASVGLIVGYGRGSRRVSWCLHRVPACRRPELLGAPHVLHRSDAAAASRSTDSDAAVSVRAWRGRRPLRHSVVAGAPHQDSAVVRVLLHRHLETEPLYLSGYVLATRMVLPGTLIHSGPPADHRVTTVASELFLSFALWLPRLRTWGLLIGSSSTCSCRSCSDRTRACRVHDGDAQPLRAVHRFARPAMVARPISTAGSPGAA